jgi:uncharacterized protein (TIGR02246 family)
MQMCPRLAFPALALAACVFAPCALGHDGNDAEAVRAVVVQQADAWNRHDAGAYSTLFTPDCDVVNVAGWWWKSRAEMQAKLTRAFSTVFAHSTLTFTDVRVKPFTRDIAFAHARWTMTGAHMPPGMPLPDAGIQTLVLIRRHGAWRIAEFQNTIGRPERPFPSARRTGAEHR